MPEPSGVVLRIAGLTGIAPEHRVSGETLTLRVILCLSGGAQAGGHGQTDRLYRVFSPETGRSGSQIESVLL